MLFNSEFESFAKVCTSIANEVSTDSGFVHARDLAVRFRAEIIVRPLLVEGMLATIDSSEKDGRGTQRWAVLLDSEENKISQQDVNLESATKPLPVRTRNTIAHELTHSLAFRAHEFGVRLTRAMNGEKNRAELVRTIEREIERLSPLLLWSEKSLIKLLKGRDKALSLAELVSAQRALAISRYVMINRLRLISPTDAHGLRSIPALRDMGIGLAQWQDDGQATLRKWPLFLNFERNLVPEFLMQLLRHDNVPAKLVFSDSAFAICGGSETEIEVVSDAGTPHAPKSWKDRRYLCSIEAVSRRPGQQFLFVVRDEGGVATSA